MKNNQKGITLIALVVTIIVLLILAGVSIAMLSGQTGILKNAQTAAWQTKIGEAKDIISLTASNYYSDYITHEYAGTDYTIEALKDDAAKTDAEALLMGVNEAKTDLEAGDKSYTITVAEEGEEGQKTLKSITIQYGTDEKHQTVGTPGNSGKINWVDAWATK